MLLTCSSAKSSLCLWFFFVVLPFVSKNLSQGKKSPQQQISDLLEDADDGFGDIWNSWKFSLGSQTPKKKALQHRIMSNYLTCDCLDSDLVQDF